MLLRTGSSVTVVACITMLASLFLLGAALSVHNKVAVLMIIGALSSWFYTMVFLPALLVVRGPLKDRRTRKRVLLGTLIAVFALTVLLAAVAGGGMQSMSETQ